MSDCKTWTPLWSDLVAGPIELRPDPLLENAGLRPPRQRAVDPAVQLVAQPLEAREVDGHGEDTGLPRLEQDLFGAADDRVAAAALEDVAARRGDHEVLDRACPDERAPGLVKLRRPEPGGQERDPRALKGHHP